MLKKLNLLLATVLLCANASASIISEDFSGGLNGWSYIQTSSGTSASGFTPTLNPVSLVASGDNYIQYRDVDANFMHAVFGDGWSGDLSAFNNGTFSFDYVQTAPSSGSSFISTFGYFRIFGGNLTATATATAAFDAVANNPSTNWATQTFTFDAATFGVSESDWNTIISNVTGIWLNVESWNGVAEFVGLDNISLRARATSVSEPTLLGLFGIMVASMLTARRTSKRK
jgi:hypothetical protein